MIREEQITNIIGKNKAFEPPFRIMNNYIHNVSQLRDRNGSIAITMTRENDDEIALAYHICDLLNREHCKKGGEICRKVWIARDKDGWLWAYIGVKPHKREREWFGDNIIGSIFSLDSDTHPEVKWEDAEPTEVEVTINVKRKSQCH